MANPFLMVQTGSGKMYTMGTGYTLSGNTEGIIPLVMEAIYKKVKELKDQGEILLKVSFIEVGLLLIFALELAVSLSLCCLSTIDAFFPCPNLSISISCV